VGRQGIEPWTTRLKVGDSATELTARATRAGPVSTSSRLLPFIGLPPRSSESQHRTDDLPIMSRALWPTELSRHSWPPRDRTAQYLRIRQAPSTSWVVASGEGESRTRKAEAQLLSGQIPSPIGLPLHGGRRRTRISGPSGSGPHNVNASPGSRAGQCRASLASGLRVKTPPRRGVTSRKHRDGAAAFWFVTSWRIGCVVTVTRCGTEPAFRAPRFSDGDHYLAISSPMSGERRTRIPHRSAHSLAARPGTRPVRSP
jgi:hypothetical protein